MPVFLNAREQPELRMACFAALMHTLPSERVIDQLVFALTKERSRHVLAFAYHTLHSIASTKNPIYQSSCSKHIQNALKLLKVDEQTLKTASGRVQIPFFSDDAKEGVFVNLYSAFASRSALPVHVAARLNSLLNGEFRTNELGVSISQQNIDDWLEQALNAFNPDNDDNDASTSAQAASPTSGQRREASTLHDIYTALNIKKRLSSPAAATSYTSASNRDADRKPFAMLNIRIGDVDRTIVTINGGEIGGAPQRLLKTMMSGNGQKRLTLAQMRDQFCYIMEFYHQPLTDNK